MPSLKKKGGKKHSGFTLGDENEDAPISIFTDSQDRIPEIDNSADNPFFGEGSVSAPEPVKRLRSSKRHKISIPGEGEQTVEEAEQREDGLVYVL